MLIVSGFYACVRHLFYAAGFLILWSTALTDEALATALLGSFYLVIGTCFEERRLKQLYGKNYHAYHNRVPAFFLWRGKAY